MVPASDRLPRVVTLARLSPPFYSGGGLQATRLAEALAAKGCPVKMLTARHPEAPHREMRNGVEVHRLVGGTSERLRALDFGFHAALWLLRHRDWDLLHTHSFNYWTLPAAAVARRLGRPIILTTTLLGSDDPGGKHATGIARWLIMPSYRRCDAHIALSEEVERQLRADGRCRGRILRIPNGVDVDRFRPPGDDERATARAKLEADPDDFVVVACGALIPRKNVSGLVRAGAHMRSRPVKLVVIGPEADAGESARIRRAREALPDGVELSLLGHVPPDEIAQLLWGADAFTLNSLSEGLPLSLVEAMASGVPCVATDIPGSRDVLATGGGRLVPTDDDVALAAALDWLADDPARRKVLAKEAREIAVARYSWSGIADRYLELYRELGGRSGAGGSVSVNPGS